MYLKILDSVDELYKKHDCTDILGKDFELDYNGETLKYDKESIIF